MTRNVWHPFGYQNFPLVFCMGKRCLEYIQVQGESEICLRLVPERLLVFNLRVA